MKKTTSFIFFIFFVGYNLKSQDTVYSYSFPNGIITKETKKTAFAYKFYPIQNPNCEIVIRKDEVQKICSQNGTVFTNVEYVPEKNIVFSTEPTTGKISIEAKIEFNGLSCKSLYKSVKQMATGTVDYYLVSSDDIDYSFQNYKGRVIGNFAGDSYQIIFSLNIKFKDGKVKYEFRDFCMMSEETHTKGGSISTLWYSNFLTTTSGSNTTVNKKVIPLEVFYCGGNKYSDIKSFWLPIHLGINNSINSIIKVCNEAKEDW